MCLTLRIVRVVDLLYYVSSDVRYGNLSEHTLTASAILQMVKSPAHNSTIYNANILIIINTPGATEFNNAVKLLIPISTSNKLFCWFYLQYCVLLYDNLYNNNIQFIVLGGISVGSFILKVIDIVMYILHIHTIHTTQGWLIFEEIPTKSGSDLH